MTEKTIPPLDTPEARWAYALQLWHTNSLPTPDAISVDGMASVWLPKNERGQVDQWLVAMGGGTSHVYSMNRPDGEPNPAAHYAAITMSGFHVSCYMDLTADADAHGGPIVRSDLAAAAESVVAMLADEPNPICNKQIAVEQHCARDVGHDGDCNPLVPQLAAGWKNQDGTIGRECACGVTLDGFEPKDAALLDELFDGHECNTLPPVCGYLRGCNLGPDLNPAPAESDGRGLCTQHRAEVYPELVGGA